jgi:prepilin-type N-terminal cleavage/methylation domain-containing protein
MKRNRNAGFTLVELMIVVAIIGLLSAIAIPAFSKYVKKSRGAEAAGSLQKMWAGSASYYLSDHADSNTVIPEKQFPGPAGTTEDPVQCACQSAGKCPGYSTAFSDPVWTSLGFSLADPHLFMPAYASSGTADTAVFTAQVIGDLDCDGVLQTFQRIGAVVSGDPTGASAAAIINEGE